MGWKVVKFDSKIQKEVGISSNGSEYSLENAEVYSKIRDALDVANKYGGKVFNETQKFGKAGV